MIDIQNCKAKGYRDFDISYTLMRGNCDTKRLAILLPGAEYSIEKPLFHYITSVYINSNIDVLHIKYCYDQEHFNAKTKEDLLKALKHDVNTVITIVLKQYNYESFQLISKSLGTIALSSLISKKEFKTAKLIWLTPLLKNDEVFLTMRNCSHRSLSIIGNVDPNYNEKRFNLVKENQNMIAKLITGTNQSLERSDNIIESLNILKKIMIEITKFIDED
ncbi:hypothetical protein [Bacillus massiliigorillae]|uniref:hypothetical protein n=1 Tax=Bacillus massiliigorillae TaxID=1243664 RepID=UPI0003A85728|nr:hypothetical protein [Bacillus massiliigorillae]